MSETKGKIVSVGLQLWRNGTETDVSARKIAAVMGISHAAVLYWFENAEQMRDHVARVAVATGDAVIIPKLIVAKHAAVADMSAHHRQAYLSTL